MTHELRLTAIASVVTFVLSGCGETHSTDDGHDHSQDEADSPSEDEHDEGDVEGVIRLDQHELSEFGIRMAIAEPGVLRETASLAGELHKR